MSMLSYCTECSCATCSQHTAGLAVKTYCSLFQQLLPVLLSHRVHMCHLDCLPLAIGLWCLPHLGEPWWSGQVHLTSTAGCRPADQHEPPSASLSRPTPGPSGWSDGSGLAPAAGQMEGRPGRNEGSGWWTGAGSELSLRFRVQFAQTLLDSVHVITCVLCFLALTHTWGCLQHCRATPPPTCAAGACTGTTSCTRHWSTSTRWGWRASMSAYLKSRWN